MRPTGEGNYFLDELNVKLTPRDEKAPWNGKPPIPVEVLFENSTDDRKNPSCFTILWKPSFKEALLLLLGKGEVRMACNFSFRGPVSLDVVKPGASYGGFSVPDWPGDRRE